MAITGPASFVPTINSFLSHWQACNQALPPAAPLLVRLLKQDITVTRAQLAGIRDTLVAQQGVVQGCLTDQQIARGAIDLQKTTLLARFNQFNTHLDANYPNTDFYAARPFAPSITDGQEVFSRAILSAIKLWEKLNAGPPPAGMTLPLVLPQTGETPGTLDVSGYASALSSLQFAYGNELDKGQIVTIARAKRDRIQDQAYEYIKAYRENVPGKVSQFPELVETMPRLTPFPGHTPDAVNASAVFEAPNASKIVHDASTDSMLEGYELRGNVGDQYSDEDAVVIATHGPNDPREFVTTFGLTQPGAQVAFKVFVILTTGNEAGSAAMSVERPANVQLAA